MNVTVIQGRLVEQNAEALLLFIPEDRVPEDTLGAVDQALGGAIQHLLTAGDFSGKAGQTAVLYTRGALPAARIILSGLGPTSDLDASGLRQAAAAGLQLARTLGARSAATAVHGAALSRLAPDLAAQAVVEGAVLGLYEFRTHKSKPAEKALTQLALVDFETARIPAVTAGVRAGQITAEGANFARDLVNQPPNICTPAYLADQAQALGATGLNCVVLEPGDMERLGMGALLGVAAASVDNHPPRFIILEHRLDLGAPVVLVGKGITFDTGGLDIKNPEGMLSMKSDMAGGAAVLGTLKAAAELDLPIPLVGLVAASENMIGQRGFRPSDVLRAMNGKTIEVTNTDAEGRLVLADALVYAARYQPRAVVDLATLTGACVIALGQNVAAGVFATDDALLGRLQQSSQATGERIWPLPLYPEYSEMLRSEVADMLDSAGTRYAGVGFSAAFLKEFAEGYPWAHLDIAGMALREKPRGPWTVGPTGFGVRLLIDLLRHWAA